MGEMAVAMSDAALELAEALRAHRAALAELDAGRRALAEAARRHTRERSPRAKRAVRDAQATVDAATRRVVEIGREVGRLSAKVDAEEMRLAHVYAESVDGAAPASPRGVARS
jgi:hypothetical protein